MSSATAHDAGAKAERSPPRTMVLVGPLPPPSGGMANQTRQLAQLLGNEACRVTVVQVNAPYRPAAVGRLPVVRALFRLMPFVVRLVGAIRRAELVHVMANSGWAWHLHACPAIWIASWLRVPTVVNYRGGGLDAFLARQARWVGPTLARATFVVVPSTFLQQVFAKYGVAARIVPNIVDLEQFRPGDFPPGRVHVVVTRNLEPIYDIGTALRAFARVVAGGTVASLTVAGSGPERSALESLARQLGIAERVHFTGRLDNARLPALYRSASIALNPSLVDNLPVSLLEAMASGVPIVTTDVGGIPHVVEHGVTALLVPPGNPEAMASAMQRLLDAPELASRLRAAGLEAARRYAWPRVRTELFDVYAEALRSAPPVASAVAR